MTKKVFEYRHVLKDYYPTFPKNVLREAEVLDMGVLKQNSCLDMPIINNKLSIRSNIIFYLKNDLGRWALWRLFS